MEREREEEETRIDKMVENFELTWALVMDEANH
jgi:hypothetical protein